MKHIAVVLFALILAGCSKPSVNGVYQSVGSEDKFRMTLEVADGGRAKFATRSNLGNLDLDRAVESTMSIADGRWTREGQNLLVAGTQPDGKSATYRFLVQGNGDLVWEKNGARLIKAKAK